MSSVNTRSKLTREQKFTNYVVFMFFGHLNLKYVNVKKINEDLEELSMNFFLVSDDEKRDIAKQVVDLVMDLGDANTDEEVNDLMQFQE